MRNGLIALMSGAIALGGGTLSAQRGAPAGRQTVILEQAPKDHAVYISKAKLSQYLKDMDAKKLQTLRMIEGGKFNVNIRRITNAETALVHPTTIDTWVVLEGSGTLTTGGTLQNGKIVGGESHPPLEIAERRRVDAAGERRAGARLLRRAALADEKLSGRPGRDGSQ